MRNNAVLPGKELRGTDVSLGFFTGLLYTAQSGDLALSSEWCSELPMILQMSAVSKGPSGS